MAVNSLDCVQLLHEKFRMSPRKKLNAFLIEGVYECRPCLCPVYYNSDEMNESICFECE